MDSDSSPNFLSVVDIKEFETFLNTIKQPDFIVYASSSSGYVAVNPLTGDSITNTSFSTLMATLNSALTSGGRIEFRTGTYNVDNPITLSNNIDLIGSGRGKSTFLRTTTNNYNTITYTGSNAVIQGITFDGNYPTNTTNVNWRELSVLSGTNVNLRDCEFRMGTNGLVGMTPTYGSITGCYFVGPALAPKSSPIWADVYGIYIHVSDSSFVNTYGGILNGGNFVVERCYFQNHQNQGGAIAGGASTTNAIIKDNVIYGGGANSSGIEVTNDVPANTSPGADWIITGNYIIGCQNYGIVTDPGFPKNSAIISNNTVKNLQAQWAEGSAGICLLGPSSTSIGKLIIENNFCYDDQTSHTQNYGIYINTGVICDNLIIKNNVCFNNVQYQIRDLGTATSKIITNNHCI
jgi:hypothetical protein